MEISESEILLKQHGVSPTPNRILVIKELAEAKFPLSLSELEERLDSLDKSSIFRVLNLLSSNSVVHSLEDGRGISKYELCHSDHSIEATADTLDSDLHCHFYCTQCRRTFCLPDLKVPDPDVPKGFQVKGANYMLKGLCPECS